MIKTILQFGAGNIGRSLVGFIFSELGYRIIFVEKKRKIVDLIKEKGEYQIIYREENNGSYTVRNIDAVYLDDREKVVEDIKKADVISTAVGGGNLPEIAPILFEGLKDRKDTVNILICENLKNSSEFLKRQIDRYGKIDYSRVGLIETSIAKMVPDVPAEERIRDPLISWAERYSTVYINEDGIRGEFVKTPYLIPVKNFEAYYNRKIYVSNMSHTLSSIIGFINGFKHIAEALLDKNILSFVKGAVAESEEALRIKYPFMYERDGDIHYSEDFLRRLKNPFLMDTVYRGGRDIQRKLLPGERLVGPTVLYYKKLKKVPKRLAKGIAAAFYFEAPGPEGKPFEKDVQLRKRMENEGIENVLEEITGINPDTKLGEIIIREYKKGRENFLSKNLL